MKKELNEHPVNSKFITEYETENSKKWTLVYLQVNVKRGQHKHDHKVKNNLNKSEQTVQKKVIVNTNFER